MSFLSVVNLSNAASIAALSVLASTTRKFFWLSGGAVTCYRGYELGPDVESRRAGDTHANASQEQSRDRVLFSGSKGQ